MKSAESLLFKVCTKCNTEKPLSEEFFHHHPLGRGGWHPQCRICRNTANSKNGTSPARWLEILNQQRKRRVGNEEYGDYLRGYYRANKVKLTQKNRLYVIKNLEKIKSYQSKWRVENRDRLLAEKQKWQRENSIRLKPRKRAAELSRWRSDPRFRVSKLMSHAIRQSMRGGKKGRSWENIVGYNLAELTIHLEKQFKPGMSWLNYGFRGWHIDHERPLASFTFATPEDDDFKKCWALSNLQPLWATENLKKGSK